MRRFFVGGRRVVMCGGAGTFVEIRETGNGVASRGRAGTGVATRGDGSGVGCRGRSGTRVGTRPRRTSIYVMVIVGVTSMVAFALTVVEGMVSLSR